MTPWFVVKPKSMEEVRRIVTWANETDTRLVPVSSGAPHFYGDTVPSVPGGAIVDLSRMNAIKRIDRRNRIALIEPGVTYGQLQSELAKEGLRLSTPLLPRRNKSVVASLLERQPTIIPRYQYSMTEPLRNLGVVWGNGDILYTGEAGSSVYYSRTNGKVAEGRLTQRDQAKRIISGSLRKPGIYGNSGLGLSEVRVDTQGSQAFLYSSGKIGKPL